MRNKILLGILIILILTVNVVTAHKPIFENGNSTFQNPIVISNSQISYAVYGKLHTREDVDFIKFKARKGDEFYIQLNIPKIKDNKAFKPYIALMGNSIAQKDKVPFKIPNNLGSIVLPPMTYTNEFYEKFTRTTYYKAQTLRGQVPKDGEYYIAIYDLQRGGKYTLTIGEKEDFKLADTITLPLTYIRVKYFFKPFTTIFTLIGVILMVGSIIYLKKLHRRF